MSAKILTKDEFMEKVRFDLKQKKKRDVNRYYTEKRLARNQENEFARCFSEINY